MTLPQPVRLYDQPRAPNPRRVNIFLAEKGIEIERVNVDLMAGEHKQPDYLARIGVAQVPALELDDGTILTESVAICRYVEALQPEPNMMGRDVMEQVTIEKWQRLVEFRCPASGQSVPALGGGLPAWVAVEDSHHHAHRLDAQHHRGLATG